eukprot:357591-Chlamydomonas_euryale.AAC.2
MAHYALHPKRTKFKRTKGSAAERSRSSLAARYAVRYAVHDAVLYVPYLNAVERSGARLAACYEYISRAQEAAVDAGRGQGVGTRDGRRCWDARPRQPSRHRTTHPAGLRGGRGLCCATFSSVQPVAVDRWPSSAVDPGLGLMNGCAMSFNDCDLVAEG